ncbi:MAG: hypothetical protein DYG98_24280 [Haliscomenobacteraceae bacterium CHB4]|nr:hypothetical protein [Haliscomenobacteraceae bacterium CHB4]
MTREQILQEIELLDFDEERIKQQMRWYATFPELVPGGKKATDQFINEGLEKLRLIKELRLFWYKKLQEI